MSRFGLRAGVVKAMLNQVEMKRYEGGESLDGADFSPSAFFKDSLGCVVVFCSSKAISIRSLASLFWRIRGGRSFLSESPVVSNGSVAYS
ncbi:MAG: hypothetical protein AAGB46_11045 [Verrucomicrobiota bacterium]